MVKDYIIWNDTETFLEKLRCQLKLIPLSLHFQNAQLLRCFETKELLNKKVWLRT